MSVEMITWALKQPVQQSSAKFVLIVLANCSDAVERLAWPSVAYVCEATSQDRKTVMANIKKLAEAGFIEDSGERKGGTKSVVVWRLTDPMDVASKLSQKRDSLDAENDDKLSTSDTKNGTSSKKEAVPFFPRSSTVFPHKQYRFSLEAVPKTGHGTVKNRHGTVKNKNPRAAAPPTGVLDSVWQDFLKIRKARNAPVTKTALDRIASEAEKAGIGLGDALAMCCSRGWGGFEAEWLADKRTAGPPAPGVVETVPSRQGVDPALAKIAADRARMAAVARGAA